MNLLDRTILSKSYGDGDVGFLGLVFRIIRIVLLSGDVVFLSGDVVFMLGDVVSPRIILYINAINFIYRGVFIQNIKNIYL